MRLSRFIIVVTLLIIASPICRAQTNGHKEDRQAAAAAFEEGQNAQQRGDHSAAVRYYSNAINAAPSLYQPYYQRATALIALARDKEAEVDLRKVITMEPNFARAYRALGQVLLDRDAVADAKLALARALELDPKITGVRLLYASALIKTKEPQKALEHLRAAVPRARADRGGGAARGQRSREHHAQRTVPAAVHCTTTRRSVHANPLSSAPKAMPCWAACCLAHSFPFR